MADVVGLTVIKKFTYRNDATEEWSNQYHFTGALPSDDAAWVALFDALVAQEKTLYPSYSAVVAGYGYTSDDPSQHAQWTHDISASPVAGTYTVGSGHVAPGDAAMLVSWKTSRTNSRGKAIYLRKYFHNAVVNPTNQDVIDAGLQTAAAAFALKLYDGTFIDGRTLRSRGNSETLLTHAVANYVTTRTLKRRGKRPS